MKLREYVKSPLSVVQLNTSRIKILRKLRRFISLLHIDHSFQNVILIKHVMCMPEP